MAGKRVSSLKGPFALSIRSYGCVHVCAQGFSGRTPASPDGAGRARESPGPRVARVVVDPGRAPREGEARGAPRDGAGARGGKDRDGVATRDGAGARGRMGVELGGERGGTGRVARGRDRRGRPRVVGVLATRGAGRRRRALRQGCGLHGPRALSPPRPAGPPTPRAGRLPPLSGDPGTIRRPPLRTSMSAPAPRSTSRPPRTAGD